MNQHMVIIACVQTPPSPQETSIFPEGRAGGSVHRLGHKEENTVTYFRAAFLAQHQPPYYGLLTQTHFQIAGLYWWRFFLRFTGFADLSASFPVVLGDFGCVVSCQACWENSLSRSAPNLFRSP